MKTKIKFKTKIILTQTASWFFVLFLVVVNSNAVSANDLYYDNPQITPAKMFILTNQAREENGLFTLTVNQKLATAAEAKVDDMFRYQYFDHNSPNGTTPWDWIKKAGYDYRYAGENLAIDFVTAERAQKALMASDSHRENILNRKYTEIGIAVKKDIFEKGDSIIIVMEFGTPLKTEAVYASSDNANEEIKLSDSKELDNKENKTNDSINIIENIIEKKPQKKIINSQPLAIPSTSLDIKKQTKKEIVRLNNEKSRSSSDKKNAYDARMIKFVGMSVNNIKKNELEKVYLENIYWKSYDKKNTHRQTTVMSSGRQSKGGFNSDVLYVCVLLILFIFESSYLFSNFLVSSKLETESVQAGES